jgi:radical SAM superfamily enzyme YgiQ (UPF0313 family)
MEPKKTIQLDFGGVVEKPLKRLSPEIAIKMKLADIKHRRIRKILLIQPLQIPVNKIDIKIAKNKRYYTYPPYALGILNSILKKNKLESNILDLNIKIFSEIIKNEDIQYEELETLWRSELTSKLEEFSPDVVGVGCTFTMNHQSMIDIFDIVKDFDKKIITIAGGVHVTNATDIVLKDSKNADFAVRYEAELSFINFLNYIKGEDNQDALFSISTLYSDEYFEYAGKQLTPQGKDLDVIPDYGSVDISRLSELGEIGTFRYWRPKNSKSTPVLSNKGCRARCSFCSVRHFNGKGVRLKSVEIVLDEISLLKEKFGINHITWLDDDLFFDFQRTLELFNGMVKQNLELTWDASNGIIASAAVAHPEIVAAAAESGCIGMYFGIESGNDKILKDVYKPSSVKHYLKLGELMKKYPQIFTRGFLMIGFPHETLSQIRDTIRVAIEMELDWNTVQLLTPLPSTEIYNQMVEEGMIVDGSLNIEGEGYTMFSVRESERQRKIEELSKRKNSDFVNLLNANPDHVPSRKELNDLWFLSDFEINYRPIPAIDDLERLNKLKAFLTDISDRMTRDNPLSSYFLSIVEDKLGNTSDSVKRKIDAKHNLGKSIYWQERFDTLGLDI